MSGRRLGTLRSVPLPVTKLDRIYKFTKARGSAWPHDIALTSEGRPRIVYTRRVGHRDTFFYAYHNGEKWVSRKIVAAGPGFPSFTSGGRRSITRTRASSTCRGGAAPSTRWRRGSRPTTGAPGGHGS